MIHYLLTTVNLKVDLPHLKAQKHALLRATRAAEAEGSDHDASLLSGIMLILNTIHDDSIT